MDIKDIKLGSWYWCHNKIGDIESGGWVLPIRPFKDGSTYVETYCGNMPFSPIVVISMLTTDPPEWAPDPPLTVPKDWKENR